MERLLYQSTIYQNAITLYIFVNKKYAHLMLKGVIIEDYYMFASNISCYSSLFFVLAKHKRSNVIKNIFLSVKLNSRFSIKAFRADYVSCPSKNISHFRSSRKDVYKIFLVIRYNSFYLWRRYLFAISVVSTMH